MSARTDLSVSLAIVFYRTGPALRDGLAALSALRGVEDIILIDNGSDESEAALLDAFVAGDPRARLVRGQGNVGFAAACNRAARLARGEVIAFVNPDVILEPDAIENLAMALAQAPRPALVGGDLRDQQGRPDRGSRRERLTLWRAFVSASGLSRLERALPVLRDFNRHHDPLPLRPEPIAVVSGALMLTRTADFLALGGFDEGYFLHVEDVDFCRRAQDAGWSILFAPGPHGRHIRSTSVEDPRTIARHKALGLARYFEKFARGPIERACAWLAGRALRLAAL